MQEIKNLFLHGTLMVCIDIRVKLNNYENLILYRINTISWINFFYIYMY